MKFIRAVAVAAALLVGVTASQAGFEIKFQSGSNTTPNVSLMSLGSDSGAGWSYSGSTSSSGSNTIAQFSTLNIYGYSIDMVAVRTNSPTGNPGQLKLSSLTIKRHTYFDASGVGNESGGTLSSSSLQIAFSADGYLKPDVNRYMKTIFSGQFDGAATTGNAVFTSTYDQSNTLFGSSSYTATKTTDYNNPFSGTVFTTLPGGTGAYSLTNVMDFTNFGIGDSHVFSSGTIDTLILPVPAPAGLVLVALGIPALGLLRRFTRKTAADAVVA